MLDQRQAEPAVGRGSLQSPVEPDAGVGRSTLGGEGPAEPGEGVEVVGILLNPLLVIGDQAGEVVVAGEDLLDLVPDLAGEPALGVDLAEQGLIIAERLRRPTEPDLEIGGLGPILDPSVGVAGGFRQRLVPGQRRLESRLLGQGRRDLFLDLGIIRKQSFEPRPDLKRLVVPTSPLVNPPERLENLQQVRAIWLPGQGPLERLGRRVGLTDQDERLAQVIGRERVVRPDRFRLPERLDRRGVPPSLRLDQPDQHPGRAVVRVLIDSILVALDERIEFTPLDMVAIDPVESCPPARGFLQDGEEPFHDGTVAVAVGIVVGPTRGQDQEPKREGDPARLPDQGVSHRRRNSRGEGRRRAGGSSRGRASGPINGFEIEVTDARTQRQRPGRVPKGHSDLPSGKSCRVRYRGPWARRQSA